MTFSPKGVSKATRRKRIETAVDRLIPAYLKGELSATEVAETLVRESRK